LKISSGLHRTVDSLIFANIVETVGVCIKTCDAAQPPFHC
jgi:hypothetical protein